MNKEGKVKNRFSIERLVWEIRRAFYSFKNSPVFALLLLQAASFIIVHAKGAGKIYLDMIGILAGITIFSWFFTSVIHGNQKIVIYTLLLLTVGTMLQCILKEEQVLKNAEYYQTHNPAASLQFQYIMGFVAAVVMAAIYLRFRQISSMKLCRLFFYGTLALSVVTLIFTKGVGNVRNWISIGGISLQTTEIMKFFYVFLGAGLLGTTEQPSKERIRAFYVISFLDMVLLAAQSEFGTLLLLMMLFLTFVFLFVPDLKIFFRTIAALFIFVFFMIVTGMQLHKLSAAGSVLGTNPLSAFFLSNYDKIANRFIYWLDPEKDALGLGYQLLKAKESIVLGGWFGTSSITDLPVKTSDLVYPALIQRCGMLFAILIFLVFILMWLEGVRLFVRKQDRYHQAVAAGFVFMFFDQTLIIIAGSTGLCPLTGITLPFISSGGSSLLVSFMMIGIMVAISSNVKWKGTDNEEDEFFKENAVTAKYHAYLRDFHDHFSYKNIRPAAGSLKKGRHSKGRSQGTDV